jgi:hypothetical protein
MRGVLVRIAFIALGVCALTCTPAQSALVRLHGSAASPPALVGERTIVAVDAGSGTLVRSFEPSGAATTLGAIPGSRSTFRLAASAQVFAAETLVLECSGGCLTYTSPEIRNAELLAAAPGTPFRCAAALTPLASCGNARVCPVAIDQPLVSGSMLAWGSCRQEGATLSYATALARAPGAAPELLGTIAYPESLAGPWLVGLAPGWRASEVTKGKPSAVLVERNLTTGEEPVRIALHTEWGEPQLPPAGGEPGGEYPALASVQGDGSIVYVTDVDKHGELFSASPAAPAPHDLGPWPEANRTATEGFGPSILAAEGLVATRRGGGRVAVQRLDGTVVGVVASRGEVGFDFDGHRLAVVETPCSESFVQSWSPGEAAPAPPAGVCAVAAIVHVRFAAGAVHVALRCRSALLGCGYSSARVLGTSEEDRSEVGPLLPGAAGTVTIHPGRAWLARHRRHRVTVELDGPPGAGHHSVRVRVP